MKPTKEQEIKDWEKEQEYLASEDAKAIADLEAREDFLMTNQQPTKEQEQWLLEQCGWKYSPLECDCPICSVCSWIEPNAKLFPNGEPIHTAKPPIDLNNLFKYAVPKAREDLSPLNFGLLMYDWLHKVVEEGLDDLQSALALFWAIYKALGGKE